MDRVRFGTCSCTFFYFRIWVVQFLAKPWFWFSLFLLGSVSLPFLICISQHYSVSAAMGCGMSEKFMVHLAMICVACIGTRQLSMQHSPCNYHR